MLLICGMSRREHSLLIAVLDLQTGGQARQFLSADSQRRSPSEETESHFVMSFPPQIGCGGRGRRGSSTGAGTGGWWELEGPLYEKNITRMIMPLCFSVASPLSLSRSGLCSLCHVKVHFALLTKLSDFQRPSLHEHLAAVRLSDAAARHCAPPQQPFQTRCASNVGKRGKRNVNSRD